MNAPKPKIPILYYEEPKAGEPANPIPYIEIGLKEEMPKVLFISEYKETGEFDVDTGNGSQPIVDMLIHSFVSLSQLKKVLNAKQYDRVREALGMQPLKRLKNMVSQSWTKSFRTLNSERTYWSSLQSNDKHGPLLLGKAYEKSQSDT